MRYEQALKDWDYLWSIAPAYDMTGNYEDQRDLDDLLRCPTRRTATVCLERQIAYWFSVGPDRADASTGIPWDDPKVIEIAERHLIATPKDKTDE